MFKFLTGSDLKFGYFVRLVLYYMFLKKRLGLKGIVCTSYSL